MRSYELVGKEVRETEDLGSTSNRVLFLSTFGEVSVSTVFLIWDHSFSTESKPILFETMVFGGIHDEYQIRYHTYHEAEIGHLEVCEMISDDPQVMEYLRNQKIEKLFK